MQSAYAQLGAFAENFIRVYPGEPVDGALYGLSGTTVYHTHTQPLAMKSRIEVNQITIDAANSFEWASEITVKDKVNDEFIHLILRPDRTAAETYGKTVTPITSDRAGEIIRLIQQATELGPPKPRRRKTS